jgi:outer membrane lipoprotein carrier protein
MLLGWMLSALLAASTAAGGDARAAAMRLDAHYHDVRTLQAVFLERYIEGGQTVRLESGTVYFSRPGRMRWDYESPEKKLFLVDGKNVWFYVPADRTATRQTVKESDDWRTPLALLTGRARLDRLCGSIALLPAVRPGDEESATDGDQVLLCTPRASAHGEAPFRDVLLEIDSNSRLVRALIRQAGARETEFRFGDWRENLPLPEDKFHFLPPSGVAIVEASQLLAARP